MYDSKLVSKYIKIQALAEGGATEGEREAARARLKNMESSHPGIGTQAYQEANKPPPTPDWNWTSRNMKAQPGQTPSSTTNWNQFFKFVQEAATTAQDFIETASHMRRGTVLATLVEAYIRVIKGRKGAKEQDVLIALRMAQSTYWQAKALNSLQIQAFRKEMHDKLDALLNEMFGA